MEKYILQESKYILDERFILSEADEQVKADGKALIDSAKEKLNSYSEESIDQLTNSLKSTSNMDNKTIKYLKDTIEEIRGEHWTNDETRSAEYKKALKALNDFFKSWDSKMSSDEPIKKVAELSKKDNEILTNNDILEADKVFALISDELKNTEAQEENPEAFTNLDKVDKNEIINSLKNILEKRNEVITRLDAAKEKFDTLNDSNKKVIIDFAKVIVDAPDIDKITKSNFSKINDVSRTCERIITTLKVPEKDTIDIDELNNNSEEWEKVFSNSKLDQNEIRSLWDRYYKTWGNNEQKIRNLGNSFNTQLLHFGFSKEDNPFLVFVDTLVIKHGYEINSSAYGGINNAYVENKINARNLNASFEEMSDVLKCQDLYNHSGQDIIYYLSRSNEIIAYIRDQKAFINQDLENEYEELEDKSVDFIRNNIFQEGVKDAFSGDGRLTKLKSLTKIEAIIRNTWGEVEKIKPKMDNAWLAKHVGSAVDWEELSQAKKEELQLAAKRAIICLLLDPDAPEITDQLLKDHGLVNQDFREPVFSPLDKPIKELRKAISEINTSDIKNLIDVIASTYHLVKQPSEETK